MYKRQVHAFLPGHPRRGRGQVRGPIPPAPRVGRGRESDGDVVAQQRDGVGLRGMGGGHDRWDVLVRVGHPFGPLVKARAIGVNRRGCVVQDLARGWEPPCSIAIPLPRDVRTHKWRRFSPIWQRHCVHRTAITLIILRIGARLWRCCCIGSKLSPLVANSRVAVSYTHLPEELADADPWIRAFDVRPDNPILDALGVRA